MYTRRECQTDALNLKGTERERQKAEGNRGREGGEIEEGEKLPVEIGKKVFILSPYGRKRPRPLHCTSIGPELNSVRDGEWMEDTILPQPPFLSGIFEYEVSFEYYYFGGSPTTNCHLALSSVKNVRTGYLFYSVILLDKTVTVG